MPKASKDSASTVEQMGPMGENRHEDLGGYQVDFLSFVQDGDLAPLLVGLPDDRCQSPHWGYVVKGSLTMHVGDREEVYGAGDAFYIAPGHTPTWVAGTEIVQFSPTADIERTVEVIRANMEAMRGG